MAMPTISVPVEINTEFQKIAKHRNQSRSKIVQEALVQYLENEKYDARVHQERENEAQKGVWVSGEAVHDWMDSFTSDTVLPVPKPDIFR